MKLPRSSSTLRGGLLAKLLLILAVVFVLGAIAWVVLLPSLVVSVIRSKTGFAARVESLSVNPFTAKVAVRGFVLENPPGWSERGFVDLREFRADAELLPLLRGKLVADEITVDIGQLTVVKNREGVINAKAFGDGFNPPAQPGATPAPQEPAPQTEFLIRRLHLKFGQLTYIDLSGRRPVKRDYALNLSREMRDVDSVADLMSPFSGAALGLVKDVAADVSGDATRLLKDAGSLLKDTGQKATDSLKGLLEKGKP
jgi:hypothetical protein